ncbi:MAG: serine/threonine protein kinase [Rhodopirellula sp.]|nr:serine/threonine protein kinase [Rhodopirellula sp.]OUX49271.1 MAG: serine/threonine protein kinase [Rhodopirellula sp. TMED283]
MNWTSLILAAAFLSISSTLTADENWSRFRGRAATGLAGQQIPTTWSDTENLAWRTDLPGKGSSSPVIRGDKIFLTAYSGYGQAVESPGNRAQLKLHVVCLSVIDGSILWNHELDAAEEEQAITKRVADHGYASPTPCVDGKLVFASFGPSGLAALTHDGEFKWRTSIGTKTAGFGAAASPIEFEDIVIMNASIEDGALYGLDKTTGTVRWRTPDIDRAWTTPTLVDLPNGKKELVLNQKGAILGLDPETGKKLWSCDAIQDYIVPCVVAKGSTLYCSGGRSNKTFAVKAGGRGDVTATHLIWDVSRGANVTSPLLHDGHLYWSHDKAIALCLRASDGEEIFRERMPTRGRVYASIVGDGQHLFLTTRDAGVLVLAASPEYNEISINRLGNPEERFNATPAIAGDSLYLRSDAALYCVKKEKTD